MKTLLFTSLILVFSIHTNAQNVNKQTETKTTTLTVKDSKGTHKTVKKEVTKEVQKVELGQEKLHTVNIPTVDSPVLVTTTTNITNPDGSTRTVDVDRSAYYQSNGIKYKLDLDSSGYMLTFDDSKKALLLKTTTNSYIYRLDNKIAIGYFDINGNLIIEKYDENLNRVTTEKFEVVK